uniref:receptor protein-tyrosine kinase n=1 Tax=Salarias fasciatus TaxID=181472 RepID=A0A672FYJ8_SALFA
ASNSNYTVCSGWSEVTWRLTEDSQVEGVVVQNQGSSSELQLVNATWRNSGRYTCEEESSDQSRYVDIFIPGKGPDEWFIPSVPGLVMKETEEDTIPCVVSDPHLNVSLYERGKQTAVVGMAYEPGRGFTGHLNDTSYVCVAVRGHEEKTSQVFYVFSIVGETPVCPLYFNFISVLKRGEVLTVNCTVRDTEMVFFSWNFPRSQDIQPLTEFLPNQIRSFINITAVTAADSGILHVCVDRGYVYLWPSGEANTSSLLHHTVEFSVEIDAHPPPTVQWTRNNQTIRGCLIDRYMSTLRLVRVQLDQAGSYAATASNEDDEDQVVFQLEVKAAPRITALSEVDSKTVLCVSEGTPPPTVTWYTCHNSDGCSTSSGSWTSLLESSEGVTLQSNVSQVERGVAQVTSDMSNVASPGRKSIRFIRTVACHLFVASVNCCALVFGSLVFVFCWQKPGYEVRWKVIETVSPDGQQYTYLDPTHLPYNATWEIPRDRIVLGQVLGSGAFGRVVEATVSGLIHSDSTTKVAVKMVKQRRDAVQSLMSELKVLVHLGPHLNVVNLLGASTRGGPIYLITEFCRHGDLVNYLQKNKHSFLQGDTQSGSDGGYMDMNKEESVQYVAMKELNYADIEPAVYETPDTPQEAPALLLSDSPLLSLQDLLSFSFQVSQAMNFLSSRKCVHRDLAARNVLVCEGKLVKVGDFGLARDMLKDQNYVARGNSFLPLKWMAPESIFQNIYSSQSDVWSYGVLLWEIFSLGSSPYSELPMTQEFCSALKRGHRMSRPQHAPPHMYELMKQCWDDKPQSRPSFSSIVATVGNLLSDDYKQVQTHIQTHKQTHTGRLNLKPCPLFSGSSAPQVTVDLLEAEPVEAGPSHGTYILPAADVTIETDSNAAPQLDESLVEPPTAPPADQEEEEDSNL